MGNLRFLHFKTALMHLLVVSTALLSTPQSYAMSCNNFVAQKKKGWWAGVKESFKVTPATYKSSLESLLKLSLKDLVGGGLVSAYESASSDSQRAEVLFQIQQEFEKRMDTILSLRNAGNFIFDAKRIKAAYERQNGHPYPRLDKKIDELFEHQGFEAVSDFLEKTSTREYKDLLENDVSGTYALGLIRKFTTKHGRPPAWASQAVRVTHFLEKYLSKRAMVTGASILVLATLLFPLYKGAQVSFNNTKEGIAAVSLQQSAETVASYTAEVGIKVFDQDQIDRYYNKLVEEFGFSDVDRARFENDFERHIHTAMLGLQREVSKTQNDVNVAVDYVQALRSIQLEFVEQLVTNTDRLRENAKAQAEIAASGKSGEAIDRALEILNEQKGDMIEADINLSYQVALFYLANSGALELRAPHLLTGQEQQLLNLQDIQFRDRAGAVEEIWSSFYETYLLINN